MLPAPMMPPLRGGPLLRWGVVAPGRIATDWVDAVHSHTDQRVQAVASRDARRAGAFAARHGIPAAYSGYERLFDDPAIDVVYIAAPHTEHLPLALRAIAAGKHVLIEKPIAVSAAEALEIATAARAAGVFALEAMWSAFLPQAAVIRQLLADGAIGEPRQVSADFGGIAPVDPEDRVFDPALGGGALLDLGVYPAWFAHFALGQPTAVSCTGTLAVTGVDDQAALILDYRSGAQSLLSVSMRVETPRTATINGSAGRIELAGPFFAPTSMRVRLPAETIDWTDGTGFVMREGLCHQVAAVAAHVAEGRTEAPEHTLDDSVAVLRVLDAARDRMRAA